MCSLSVLVCSTGVVVEVGEAWSCTFCILPPSVANLAGEYWEMYPENGGIGMLPSPVLSPSPLDPFSGNHTSHEPQNQKCSHTQRRLLTGYGSGPARSARPADDCEVAGDVARPSDQSPCRIGVREVEPDASPISGR